MLDTDSEGNYSAIWHTSVTGIYMIRAVYEGDVDYMETNAGTNFSVTQDAENNVFSVNSNSTLSSLSFNSTNQTLSFSVSGKSGTKGYVDVYIDKTLVSNTNRFEIFLDGKEQDYTLSTTYDSWMLHFDYDHSTHIITINLGTSTEAEPLRLPNEPDKLNEPRTTEETEKIVEPEKPIETFLIIKEVATIISVVVAILISIGAFWTVIRWKKTKILHSLNFLVC